MNNGVCGCRCVREKETHNVHTATSAVYESEETAAAPSVVSMEGHCVPYPFHVRLSSGLRPCVVGVL